MRVASRNEHLTTINKVYNKKNRLNLRHENAFLSYMKNHAVYEVRARRHLEHCIGNKYYTFLCLSLFQNYISACFL